MEPEGATLYRDVLEQDHLEPQNVSFLAVFVLIFAVGMFQWVLSLTRQQYLHVTGHFPAGDFSHSQSNL